MKKRNALSLCLLLVVLGTVILGSANGSMVCQACTVGFFKNHPEFINGNSCGSYNQDTLVSSLFPGVDSCVGDLSLLGLLSSPTTVCGNGSTLAGAEVIMLRQGITRVMNATNSTPVGQGCKIANAAITKANNTINDAVATDNTAELKSLGDAFGALNNDSLCTIGQ